jgi:GTP cyclohydrolase II
MTEAGSGLLFYVRMEGRGIGLAAKIPANALETQGMDTFESRLAIGGPPEARDFNPNSGYLKKRELTSVHLLTNNPVKIQGLIDAGISVRVQPLLTAPRTATARSLSKTKAERFSYAIPLSLYSDEER